VRREGKKGVETAVFTPFHATFPKKIIKKTKSPKYFLSKVVYFQKLS
jgi:hypothetical protein